MVTATTYCAEASHACVKVVAMRLPAAVVTVHLKAILEGILLWSGDTKNQFKLKVAFTCQPSVTVVAQHV